MRCVRFEEQGRARIGFIDGSALSMAVLILIGG